MVMEIMKFTHLNMGKCFVKCDSTSSIWMANSLVGVIIIAPTCTWQTGICGGRKERFGQNSPLQVNRIWAMILSLVSDKIFPQKYSKIQKTSKNVYERFYTNVQNNLLKEQYLIMTFSSKWQWSSLHTKMYSRSMDAKKHSKPLAVHQCIPYFRTFF